MGLMHAMLVIEADLDTDNHRDAAFEFLDRLRRRIGVVIEEEKKTSDPAVRRLALDEWSLT